MTDAQWGELAKILGAALPVVALLWRILEREHDERIKLQEQHNVAMADQQKIHVQMVQFMTTAMIEVAGAMKDVANVVRESNRQHSKEHEQILEAIRTEARIKEMT